MRDTEQPLVQHTFSWPDILKGPSLAAGEVTWPEPESALGGTPRPSFSMTLNPPTRDFFVLCFPPGSPLKWAWGNKFSLGA